MGSPLHLPERCGLNCISCNINQKHVCMNLAYFQLNLRFYDRSHVEGGLYANRDERVGFVDRACSLFASRLAHIIIIIIRSSSSSSRSSSSSPPLWSPWSSPIQPHTELQVLWNPASRSLCSATATAPRWTRTQNIAKRGAAVKVCPSLKVNFLELCRYEYFTTYNEEQEAKKMRRKWVAKAKAEAVWLYIIARSDYVIYPTNILLLFSLLEIDSSGKSFHYKFKLETQLLWFLNSGWIRISWTIRQ